MKPHCIALVALAGLYLAGCRSTGNLELLEREIRDQEDEIYYLEDQLDSCAAQLESTMRENNALKRDLTKGDRAGLDSSATPTIDFPSTPASPRRGGGTSDAAPLVEPGVEIDPGQEFDPSATPAAGASSSKRITDHTAERIVLNKQLTGGISHDGGGAQGVLVVFEPRNRAGQMLDTPGAVSIAVLDPQRQGPQARVARWDFSADEAAKSFRKTALGRGFQFELPWPSGAPANKKLQLFVRYVAADGRKLMADMPIDVAPRSDRDARRWRGLPPGTRRSQAAGRSRVDRQLGGAPAYSPSDALARSHRDPAGDEAPGEPTARFLDPPQIIPEEETADLRGRDDSGDDDGERFADERDAKPKKKSKDDRLARPVWSPYR